MFKEKQRLIAMLEAKLAEADIIIAAQMDLINKLNTKIEWLKKSRGSWRYRAKMLKELNLKHKKDKRKLKKEVK